MSSLRTTYWQKPQVKVRRGSMWKFLNRQHWIWNGISYLYVCVESDCDFSAESVNKIEDHWYKNHNGGKQQHGWHLSHTASSSPLIFRFNGCWNNIHTAHSETRSKTGRVIDLLWPKEKIIKVVKNFSGNEHRLELVRVIKVPKKYSNILKNVVIIYIQTLSPTPYFIV